MKELIKNQMLAALATLNQSIENCSDNEWEKSHNDAPFSQVVFHTLFYIDFYLSINECEFKLQQFHKENKNIFKDYEELEYKEPEQIYTKKEIRMYLNFCYNKINGYFDKIENNLLLESKHRKMKIIELLIYVIRHIQHHAAQLGLRVQQVTGKELNWVTSGWIKQ